MRSAHTTLPITTVIEMHCLCHLPIAERRCNVETQIFVNLYADFFLLHNIRFAGVVVFSIIGFKATATYDVSQLILNFDL